MALSIDPREERRSGDDRRSPPTSGVKYDAGKPRFDLLPGRALEEVSKVLAYGCRKYKAENWRRVPGWRWRYVGAALRHLYAYQAGEVLDPESGCHHLAHAACCVLFLFDLELVKVAGGSVPDAWEGSEPPVGS